MVFAIVCNLRRAYRAFPLGQFYVRFAQQNTDARTDKPIKIAQITSINTRRPRTGFGPNQTIIHSRIDAMRCLLESETSPRHTQAHKTIIIHDKIEMFVCVCVCVCVRASMSKKRTTGRDHDDDDHHHDKDARRRLHNVYLRRMRGTYERRTPAPAPPLPHRAPKQSNAENHIAIM